MQSSIALYNYQATPDWEIYVDGRRVETLPFKARQGQRITIKDGVTYLGIIPLPATDLGRTDEVVLREGEEQTFEKMKFRPRRCMVLFSAKAKGLLFPSGSLGAEVRAHGTRARSPILQLGRKPTLTAGRILRPPELGKFLTSTPS